jgi:hypothetical protein
VVMHRAEPVDQAGIATLRPFPESRREKLLELIATLPSCVVARRHPRAHYRGRQFAQLGHAPG